MNNQEDASESDKNIMSDSECPIQSNNSGFVLRLKSLINKDTVTSFSKKCGIPESTIRSYLARGKTPHMKHLVAISLATSVTIDWLTTGNGIKYTKDLKHAEERLRGAPPAVLPELPPELEPYRKRLDALLIYLSMIEDAEERSQIIDSFVLRAQDQIDLAPLKDYFTKTKTNNQKK